jgi:hypothetical protein
MTEHRPYAVWLRCLAGLLALAGALGLGGCGGGSGAPNNVFNTPGTLAVTPNEGVVAYSGTPIVLTITGGQPPYQAFSSNSGVLPVAQSVAGSSVVLFPANVAADTQVSITIQDTPPGGTPAVATAVITVRAAPLVNSLTITPNSTDCGTTAICSGQDGTATVTVLGPQGGPIAGRAVRFDVVSGAYLIKSGNPANPLVTSLVVNSDQNGLATVIITANVNAPTQFAQLRVTDLTSGQQITGTFLIQQVTDGTKILTIVPSTATITGAFKGECSTNFATDYFIYGGTPPYHIAASFPQSIILSTTTVLVSGGFFEAITNGACVDPLTFTIVDATGRQTTATLSNVEGTAAVPVITPAALTISPGSYTDATVGGCSGKSFPFAVAGGTPAYNLKAATVGGSGSGATTVTPSSGGPGIYLVGPIGKTGGTVTQVIVLDQGTPQNSVTATITCAP